MSQNNSQEPAASKSSKDFWDKAETISKFIVPLVVAGSALWFNQQINQRQISADMAQIAVGILTEDPSYEPGATDTDPLREWAIAVLVTPGEITPLPERAADRLRQQGLPTQSGWSAAMNWRAQPPKFETADQCENFHRGVERLFVELGWMDVERYCNLFSPEN